MNPCTANRNFERTVVSLEVLEVECVGPVFLSQFCCTPLVLHDYKPNRNKLACDESSLLNVYDETLHGNLCGKSLKEQDHYAILGLAHLRFKATEDDIKRAYRNEVLRHHPDKNKANGTVQGQSEGEYFSRITKAWEILGNLHSRRSYDSIDPLFDNSIPSLNEYNKKNCYTVFGRAFELNSRWSEKTPVPQFGDESTSKDDVMYFYSFWYNFQSWREFSYLNEANNDYPREVRKSVQKENKQQRAKRKKAEMARIRKLVDTAYAIDPRVSQYKKEEQEAKEAMKQAKKDMSNIRREDEKRKIKASEDALRLEKEMEDEKERLRQNAMKAEHAANKQALKKAKSAFRKVVKKNNYFCDVPEELVTHMINTEKLCESLDANELSLLSSMIEGRREVFLNAVARVEKNIHDEVQKTNNLASTTSKISTLENTKDLHIATPWTPEEIQLLHKAMRTFPAGANKRWESVSNYVNQHCKMNDKAQRSSKEVLLKARELQSSVYCRNTTSRNEKAQNVNYINHSHNVSDAQTSFLDINVKQSNVTTSWTASDHKLLENALALFPTSTPGRWDKIAEHVPNKTKRECMKRYKEIAEKLKNCGQNNQL